MSPSIRLAVALGALAAIVAGQEGAASKPAPNVKLPVAENAKPFEASDAIVVVVSRAVPVESTSRPASRKLPDWRIDVGPRTFALDRAGFDALRAHLLLQGKAKMAANGKFSERELLIKADADAPYAYVQKIMEAAAEAKIYRISMAAAAKPDGVARAFDSWLPRDKGSKEPQPVGIIDEIRVILSWNQQAGRLERLFGQQLVPATPEGNERLEKLIRESRAAYAERGKGDVPLIIDAGPLVPWDQIVEVMTRAKRAGVTKIEFGYGLPLGK